MCSEMFRAPLRVAPLGAGRPDQNLAGILARGYPPGGEQGGMRPAEGRAEAIPVGGEAAVQAGGPPAFERDGSDVAGHLPGRGQRFSLLAEEVVEKT